MHRARVVAGGMAGLVALAGLGACGTKPGPTASGPPPAPARLELATGGSSASSARGALPAGAPAMFPVRPASYVLDAPLADLGRTAPVWRLTPHAVTIAEVERFARALHLTGTPAPTPGGYALTDGSSTLTFGGSADGVQVAYGPGAPNATGGAGAGSAGTASAPGSGAIAVPPNAPSISATVPSPPSTAAVDVPDAAHALTIARAILDGAGVLEGEQWATDVYDAGGVAYACAVGVPCPPIEHEVTARTVAFSLVLDGVRVRDAALWSVTIGAHGRVDWLNGQWATPSTLGSYPLRSTSAVLDDLRHGRARYVDPVPMMLGAGAARGSAAGGAPMIAVPSPVHPLPVNPLPVDPLPMEKVHITGVSLGVARWNAFQKDHMVVDLVPTYRFHVKADGQSTYDIEVLALDPSLVDFTSPSVPVPVPTPLRPAPAPVPEPAPAPAVSNSPRP